jgi:predicted secreted hydrolase
MSSPTPTPMPVPPSKVAIKLPADQYLHVGAPTEWWWHTGTLRAGDKVFGFEINAANFADVGTCFSQVMLTDVAAQRHYQNTTIQSPDNWAETDPSKDWYVRLGDPAKGPDWITMNAPQADPTQNMAIKAGLLDASGTAVGFDLTMSQDGPPFIVWGTGESPGVPGGVAQNNYYYSLTRLQCTGTITIDGTAIPVEGLTWMDHEYGKFGSAAKPVKWFLQDMQLDNGVHISHFVTFAAGPPELGVTVPSMATIQFPDGTTYFEADCTLTPVGKTWKGPDGQRFFLQFDIVIPGFDATFTVMSLVPGQIFTFGPVYEGVAGVKGMFQGARVTGTAWNEQEP